MHTTISRAHALQAPLRLGALEIPNRAFLAPLAGVSDIPFRRICQELGAGLTYVEMLSATALCYGNRKTLAMLARHPTESQLGVQVTGRTAEEVGRAIALLDREGFDAIDINMGCPVKKVVAAGCGSALLKEPDRLVATLSAARQATSRPLSAKIRLGFTRDDVNVTAVSALVATHADMLTIHGRTRSESYDRAVDLDGIAAGVRAARNMRSTILTLSNGDIFGAPDAARHLETTGADGVMVSRGALGNPWVFRALAAGEGAHPDAAEWEDVVLRHLSYQCEHYCNEGLAALLMRKHLLWYAKGFAGSKRLRERLSLVTTLSEASEIIRDFARQVGYRTLRFDGAQGHLSDGHARVEGNDDWGSGGVQHDPKHEMDRIHDSGVGAEGL